MVGGRWRRLVNFFFNHPRTPLRCTARQRALLGAASRDDAHGLDQKVKVKRSDGFSCEQKTPPKTAPQVYARHARSHGLTPPPDAEILARFRSFYATPWTAGASRFAGDGRPFWSACVAAALGVDGATPAAAAVADAVYAHYASPAAWRPVAGAATALARLRGAGVRVGVVSNFDARLPALLRALGLAAHVDAVATSAETGLEKPNPALFEVALARLGLAPGDVLCVGDDRRNDVAGGRAAGCTAWLLGVDVASLEAVAARVLGEEDDD